MCIACSKIIWFHDILVELGFPQVNSIPLYANNTKLIQIVAI